MGLVHFGIDDHFEDIGYVFAEFCINQDNGELLRIEYDDDGAVYREVIDEMLHDAALSFYYAQSSLASLVVAAGVVEDDAWKI